MKNLFVITLSVFAFGCQGFDASQTKSLELANVSEGAKFEFETDRPQCEVDTVDYELDANLLAFEIKNKNNLSVGFNILSGFFQAIGLSFKSESAEMLASMHMSEAVRPLESLADVTGKGKASKSEFKVDIDFARIGTDVGYFRQTPLHQLTASTMNSTLSNLYNEMKHIETPWQSKALVLYHLDGEMIIPAGTVAGLRLGDRFKVFNVNYVWRGEACNSELLFQRKTSLEPIAILEVTQIEKNASLLTIIERKNDTIIDVGALVEIHELPLKGKEKSRELSRSVRLRNIASQQLVIPGAESVDLSLYMKEQVTALLSNYKYYPRK